MAVFANEEEVQHGPMKAGMAGKSPSPVLSDEDQAGGGSGGGSESDGGVSDRESFLSARTNASTW